MNILTFDIEDWFHTHQNRRRTSGHIWKALPPKVEENTERILDLLERLERKATFFVLGWVAERHPELIKKIHAQGHAIGAHSYWHHNPQLLSEKDFEKDVKQCLNVLENITGEKITAYRAPGFNLRLKDKWAFEILDAYGIRADSSVQLWSSSRQVPITIKTARNQILEFPLITSPLGLPYTGGGYFRAVPQRLFQYLFRQQDYHLLYFHPRDFDPDNPASNLFSFSRNQLNRFNTGKCMNRLEQLLENIDTCTLHEAAAKYLNSSQKEKDFKS
jgi:polysaccharide deacetylase family protein (PEP-CTERM system associated)